MNRLIILFVISISIANLSIAQTNPSKEIETSESKKSLSFEGIEIQNTTSSSYRTLELRYIDNTNQSTSEITIDGKEYLYFKVRQSAISHFNEVKQDAGSSVVYYVQEKAKKEPEVLTFRVEN